MRKNVRKRTALLGLVAVVSIAVCVILSTSPARESIAQSAEGSVGGAYGNNARVTLPAAFQENWGDVNQDGKRDSTDARLVLQYSVKKIDDKAILTDAADVDGDRAVNSTDARLILQYAVKKITAFPVTKAVYDYAVQNELTDTATESAWLTELLGDGYTADIAIVGVSLDAENHLILNLSNGTTADAGRVGDTDTTTTIPSTTTTPTSATSSSTERPTTTTSPTTTPALFTVTFTDHDGTVLKTAQVEAGKDAAPPTPPYRHGYLFTGWDANFTNVVCDLTIAAEYRTVTDPALAVTNVWAKAGESVDIPVTIHNNPGIAGARFVVQYDERLTLITAKNSTALANLDYTAPATLTSPCPFNWDSLDAVSTANGAALLLTFKVPATAVAGDTFNVVLTYRKGDIYNSTLDDVDLETILGSVAVY